MSLFKKILNIFFPRRCILCGEIIEFDKTQCNNCKDSPLVLSKDFCHSCGYSSERCICSQTEVHFSHFAAVYIYSGKVRKNIHRFKFYGDRHLAGQFGDSMAFRVAESFFDVEFDCATFVPMSKRAEKERGFNQSELLALRIAKRLFIPCEELLIKTFETKKQHELGAAERKENLKGAFSIFEKASIKDKTILLCDDIRTTGSTLKECENILLKNGAKDVYCICIALSDYGDIFPIDKQL